MLQAAQVQGIWAKEVEGVQVKVEEEPERLAEEVE